MEFKKRELSLNNLIGLTAPLNSDDDVFNQVERIGQELKRQLIENEYYTNGPIIFKYNPFKDQEISIFTTIGNQVNIIGENELSIEFFQHFDLETNYYYRHYDETEAIPYSEIKNKINESGKILKTIYHVILDFYNETILDLYCEVE
ncbi:MULTISPECIES: hypothetical protein [unclassified Enterococcus]|uniref:hypothetical protein n=1 Tax=unclassified Enterococcus TaxID=2608891 RepID=UPI001554508C|nr:MULTISPECIES: hypothetical protein [unclassified Enterococcus]MBS7576313.1 hypothetical protein [Enterococcus sp. MMGLQ5-2]MBS7583546.1 hypothetical protein [Enterococcus sp. MMGLQ5-1]NPD11408.1 hypothetical protein [Enterococcus sp. MMGLQ5-1]NPD36151.1 hypothetical protein [Enterococcus sp. MMGLQ5-2]